MTKKSASTEYTVHLEGVQVARAENQLIHNVTIRLAHNEFAYLSGPVGGGKSSLLELLYGELPHTQGKAYVLGYNLAHLKRNARQALRQQRIEEVLDKVGMQGKGYKMPHELSGGEAERICIARALIVKPELILMDEPTAGLDPQTALSIGQLVQQISKEGTAVLMATHNHELMRELPAPTYTIDATSRTLQLSFPEGMEPTEA